MAEETIHHGQGVSEGIAYGPAFLISPDHLRVPRREIEPTEVAGEIERFESAVEEARDEIHRVREALSSAEKSEEAAIFDTHLLILEDAELLDSIRDRIRSDRVNAEYAFRARMIQATSHLERSEDAYLRDRVRDLRDVEHRVIRTLLGVRESGLGDLVQNAILVAHDLPASLTAGLDRDRILGFATEVGGPNSHTSILARALEIPAVIDLGPILHHLEDGEPIIVDGREGLLVQHPTEETLAEYERRRAKIERKRAQWVSLADAPGVTADGIELEFLANVDFPREIQSARAFGCDGVGLYRTEYLFLQSGGEPAEEDQLSVYRRMVEQMEGRPVTIRTIDLGGDKLLGGMEPEENPFLGWRAIRYCLDRPDVFRAQIRAILRAGEAGPVAVMIPMLTTLKEADAALEQIAAAREELEAEGVDGADTVQVGALIETPAAALLAEAFAERFDFLSLGTNDLIQYALAVDRGNRRISHLFQPFHPGVLKLIDATVRAGRSRETKVSVCGEMGSNSRAAAVLLGLGLRSFSMVPARIPRVKQVLGRIEIEEAEEVAREALEATDSDAVRELIDERLGKRFEHGPAGVG